MILARNLFFVGCIFLFIVLMYSFIPSNKWYLHENTYSVYYPVEDFTDQLVHFFVSEPFTLKIKKVEADSEALIVDFIVSEKAPEMKIIYSDLTHLIFGGFNQFTQINDIRTRILVRNEDQERLLIGVLARRDQFKLQQVKDHWKLEKLVTFINDHFNVTYGPAWSQYNQSTPPQ